MKLRIAVLTLIALTVLSSTAMAAGFVRLGTVNSWENILSSARGRALGNSHLATLQSPTAVLDNPALILDRNGAHFAYDRSNYVSDINLENYGVGIRFGNLSVIAGTRTLKVVDEIRTAYNPEGTGTLLEISDRVLVLGASYDLGPLIFKSPRFAWTVGLGHRHTKGTTNEVSYGQGDLDAGTTFRWRSPMERGLFEVSAAASGTNLLGNSFEVDERETELSQRTAFGLGLKYGFPLGRFTQDGLTFAATATSVRPRNNPYRTTALNLGLECVVYQLIALRLGYDEGAFNGTTGHGIGLVLDEHLPGPAVVRVDFSWINPDASLDLLFGDSPQEAWSVNAAWEF